jgi:hypothetical protein
MAHRHGELTLGFHPARLYLKPRRATCQGGGGGGQNLESAAIYTLVANVPTIASAVPAPLAPTARHPSTISLTRPVAIYHHAVPCDTSSLTHSEACLVSLSHAHVSEHWRVGPARLGFNSRRLPPSPIYHHHRTALPLLLLLLFSNHGRRRCDFAIKTVDLRQARRRCTPPTL